MTHGNLRKFRFVHTLAGAGALWLCMKLLPWPTHLHIGRLIGKALMRLSPRRKAIANTNINLAFPQLSRSARDKLLREHFEAVGIGLIEMGLGWWSSERFLKRAGTIHGLQYLDAAVAKGRGVILLSAHFTTLEITGHILGRERPIHALYRKNENPVVEHLLKKGRERHTDGTTHRDDIRGMIKALKSGKTVWFAFDQNYGHKGSVFSSFFGVPAATNTATSRLAKITGCLVVPFFAKRTNNNHYELNILEPLENFPSDNIQADTDRLNQLIENAVSKCPEQYLWIHRRYKDSPDHNVRY